MDLQNSTKNLHFYLDFLVFSTVFAIGTFGVGGAILGVLLSIASQFISLNLSAIASHC